MRSFKLALDHFGDAFPSHIVSSRTVTQVFVVFVTLVGRSYETVSSSISSAVSLMTQHSSSMPLLIHV